LNNNRLQDIENTSVAQNVQPYSNFVRGVRLFLPVGILAIIGVLILWPALQKIQTEPLTEQDLAALKQAETQNKLLSPTFNTQDSKGRLVKIEAKEAVQNKSSGNLIHLKTLNAQMDEGKNAIQFEANNGIYDQDKKIILLNDDVKIHGKNDSLLTTQNLKANIDTGVATSSSPAILEIQQGVIQGQSVIIDQNAQTTTFQGPAKAVINP
jgi:LPS export ABC transporter protein LptC